MPEPDNPPSLQGAGFRLVQTPGPQVFNFYGGAGFPLASTTAQSVTGGASLNYPAELWVWTVNTSGTADSVGILMGNYGNESIYVPPSTTPWGPIKGIAPGSLSFKTTGSPTTSDKFTFVFIRM
jgi:hypothetical protein